MKIFNQTFCLQEGSSGNPYSGSSSLETGFGVSPLGFQLGGFPQPITYGFTSPSSQSGSNSQQGESSGRNQQGQSTARQGFPLAGFNQFGGNPFTGFSQGLALGGFPQGIPYGGFPGGIPYGGFPGVFGYPGGPALSPIPVPFQPGTQFKGGQQSPARGGPNGGAPYPFVPPVGYSQVYRQASSQPQSYSSNGR